MLVLDTDDLPLAERAEAFQFAISGNASASVATFAAGAEVTAVLHRYEFGPGRVFNAQGSGNTLLRTPKIARREERNTIALAVPVTSTNRMRWAREERLLQEDDMLLVDLDAPYEYGWSGMGSSFAFQVDREQLDLPMDLVNKAAARLPASPVYPLVRDHLVHLTTAAERLAGTGLELELGEVTVSLMRTLVATAADSPEILRETSDTTLGPQILTYVRRHLAEPTLTPQSIAAAHHISVRQLYKACAKANISLESWIIDQRLAAAKKDLSSAAGRRRTIAATARAWCFSDPSFFSARFRRAYGMTPREWQLVTWNQVSTRVGS